MRAVAELVPAPRAQRTHDPYAGGVMTKHGWFSYDEITAMGGKLTEDQYGRPIVQFPTWSKELGRHFRVIPEHKLKEGGGE
jgi:hypothetical protein